MDKFIWASVRNKDRALKGDCSQLQKLLRHSKNLKDWQWPLRYNQHLKPIKN